MKLDKYTVGRRYGKALFELAIASNNQEEIYQELLSLRQVYTSVPELGNILSDVRLEPHEKRVIMDKLVSGYDGIVKNFLEVVYNYNRMSDLGLMIDEYEHRYNEHKGLLLGSVKTAVPLSDEQLKRLEENVAKTMDYQKVELKQSVDSSIIGGAIVEADHRVIDGSIRTQLEKMRNQLNR
ncbi:ATP synthase subunit delta [Enterococcus sp. 10A9_DIV0425]|uniref:ATP synthase subunit delta n=1 Tax=Candidatus Enterococcus wittei TaxID=1987383 RepID=A0A242JXB8_9ENTE|nr:ATP synthase F1 subunit delta [Enterococcus sp. 10A9_DIV0425]OTP09965.1 ATP synthase subunit delta [Enterococcus sp. 10A9_DIV0425]THE12572.1 F0F1 ATP synthase subunit delta [Enterococcus hirae]